MSDISVKGEGMSYADCAFLGLFTEQLNLVIYI